MECHGVCMFIYRQKLTVSADLFIAGIAVICCHCWGVSVTLSGDNMDMSRVPFDSLMSLYSNDEVLF